MNSTKGLLSSISIWGSIIGFAPLVNEIVVAVPEVTSIVVGAFGGLLAIYGRIIATSKIKGIV